MCYRITSKYKKPQKFCVHPLDKSSVWMLKWKENLLHLRGFDYYVFVSKTKNI